MLASVKCYYIMISCPSDVAESDDALKIINEWNSKFTNDFSLCFIPLFWQINSTSTINGQRPQEILNKNLVYKSDCLLVIFWAKFGSGTGKEASGTLEELKKAYELKKKIGLFFCEKPLPPSHIVTADLNQINEVKNNFKNLGIYQTYSHEFDFRAKFNHFLHEFATELTKKLEDEAIIKDSIDTQSNTNEDKVEYVFEINKAEEGFQTTTQFEIEPRREESDKVAYTKLTSILPNNSELLKTLDQYKVPTPFSLSMYEKLQQLIELKNDSSFFFYQRELEIHKRMILNFASTINNFFKLYYRIENNSLQPLPEIITQINNETIKVIHDYENCSRGLIRAYAKIVFSFEKKLTKK